MGKIEKPDLRKIPMWALSFNLTEWWKRSLSIGDKLFWEKYIDMYNCEHVLKEGEKSIKSIILPDRIIEMKGITALEIKEKAICEFKNLVRATINHNLVCAYLDKTNDKFMNIGCLEFGYYPTLKKAEKHFGFCADDLGDGWTWNDVYGEKES